MYQIGWVVPQVADSPHAAQDFIAYALNRERLTGMVDVAKNLVPRSDIGVPPELQSIHMTAPRLLLPARWWRRPADALLRLTTRS